MFDGARADDSVAPPKPPRRNTQADGELAVAFRSIVRAWYGGGHARAAVALGINRGDVSRYCRGVLPVPRYVLERVVARRDRDLLRRKRELAARIERARAKVAERLAITDTEDKLGMAKIRERLRPALTTLVHTHTGYKPIEQAKPHPRKRPTQPLLSQ